MRSQLPKSIRLTHRPLWNWVTRGASILFSNIHLLTSVTWFQTLASLQASNSQIGRFTNKCQTHVICFIIAKIYLNYMLNICCKQWSLIIIIMINYYMYIALFWVLKALYIEGGGGGYTSIYKIYISKSISGARKYISSFTVAYIWA